MFLYFILINFTNLGMGITRNQFSVENPPTAVLDILNFMVLSVKGSNTMGTFARTRHLHSLFNSGQNISQRGPFFSLNLWRKGSFFYQVSVYGEFRTNTSGSIVQCPWGSMHFNICFMSHSSILNLVLSLSLNLYLYFNDTLNNHFCSHSFPLLLLITRFLFFLLISSRDGFQAEVPLTKSLESSPVKSPDRRKIKAASDRKCFNDAACAQLCFSEEKAISA